MRVWRVAPHLCRRTPRLTALLCAARLHSHAPWSLDALPLELVLRRLQSSSLTNPARSLRAHFADLPMTQQKEEGCNNDNNNKDGALQTSSDACSELSALRSALSARLAAELTRDAAQAHLLLDEVSLMLANALRHGLQATLQQDLLRRFIELSERASTGGRMSMLSGAAYHTHNIMAGDDAAGCATRDLEALVRVLEACVDVAELSYSTLHSRATVVAVQWGVTEWAALLALLEVRWAALMQRRSTACVTLQCLSLIVAAPEQPQGSTDSMRTTSIGLAGAQEGSAGRWRRGFLHLQTDPALLRQRARQHCLKAMHTLLRCDDDAGEACGTGDAALCDRSAEELMRLCHAIARLRVSEQAAAQDAAPSGSGHGVRAGLGLRSRARPSLRWAKQTSSAEGSTDVYRRFAFAVSEAVVQHHTHCSAPDANCDGSSMQAATRHAASVATAYSSAHRTHHTLYTLPQLAAVFATLCTLYDTQGALPTSLSVVVSNALRAQCGTVDRASLEAVLRIGESCTAYSTGGVQAILCEVLRCLRAVPHALLHSLYTQQAADHTAHEHNEGSTATPHAGAPANTMWVRACEMLDKVPHTARREARMTLLRFVQVVGQSDMLVTLTGLPRWQVLQLRRGMLHLARLLLREDGGYISPRYGDCLLHVVKAAPYHDDAASGLATCIQALYVYTTLVQRAQSGQHTQSAYTAGMRNELSVIAYLLQELTALTSTQPASDKPHHTLTHLPPSDRADLREAMRVVRTLAACHALDDSSPSTVHNI